MNKHLYGLDILQASAGSGKTFHLVFSFLKIIIQNPHDYDKILAITFTNKATEEMKSRILRALSDLANGKESPFYKPLEEYYLEIRQKVDIRKHAYQALNYILLDYSNFSVSTIESFFQRVVRSFARELDIPLGYDVEMRSDYVIQKVVDDLLTEAGFTDKITQILSQFITENIEQDKGWRIEDKIRDFAQEMLKEIFQRNVGMDRGSETVASFEEKMQEIQTHIQEVSLRMENKMRAIGKEAMDYMQSSGIDEKLFSYSDGRNVARYLRGISHANSSVKDFEMSPFFVEKMMPKAPESYLSTAAKGKKADKEMNLPFAEGMAFFIDKAYDYYYSEARTEYFTALEAAKTLQSLRLIHDLQRKFAEYREENNLLLISDTSMLLNSVVQSYEDAPFVYEKIGSRYVHYLIDEFQDTSVLQWQNLLPLLRNSLSENELSQNIIVGDAKQSIYRWRGGEMKLLLEQVEKDLILPGDYDSIRIKNLQNNWRTGHEIVNFNNDLFSQVKKYYQDNLHDWLLSDTEQKAPEKYYTHLLERAYGTVSQIPQKLKIDGYVEFQFITPNEVEKNWKKIALDNTLNIIRQIEQDGFPLSDVMILTRKNAHSTEVVTYLNDNGVKVTSSESLRLDSSPIVKLLVAALYFILDERDALSASTAGFYYHKWLNLKVKDDVDEKTLSEAEQLIAIFQEKQFPLPEAFAAQRANLLRLPLYESVQKLLRIFQLHHETDAYLQGFLDWVMDYTKQNEDGIAGFLSWWEEEKKDKYVVSSPDKDSVRIMTIHKSKGLEFPIVIMPFCDWDMSPKPNTFFWANTTVAPFEGVFEKKNEEESALYPVRFSDKLIHTDFRLSYIEETFQSMMDSINMLYVAFTRPEYRLYALIPDIQSKEEKDGKKHITKRNVGKLLAEGIKREKWISGEWDEEGTVYRKGKAASYAEIHSKEKLVEVKMPVTKSDYHPIDNWEQLLRVRMQHNAVYRATGLEQIQKMSEGIVLHDALQFVKTHADIPQAIDFLQNNGSITDVQKKYFTQQLYEIVNHPIAQDWFSTKWTIKTEAEILCADGRVLRPDRVLISQQKAVIIDYKTGNPSTKYHEQISEYAEKLKEIGYTDIKGYLFYFSDNKVVEVEC